MPVHCVALATLECIRKKFINLIAVERQRTILFFGTASMHTHNIYIHIYTHICTNMHLPSTSAARVENLCRICQESEKITMLELCSWKKLATPGHNVQLSASECPIGPNEGKRIRSSRANGATIWKCSLLCLNFWSWFRSYSVSASSFVDFRPYSMK